MTTIEIPWIADSLGYSVIYEEYKGNYSIARKNAVQLLDEACQKDDVILQADVLLSLGIVRLLQGEPPAAMQYFAEIDRLVPSDAIRRYRAAIYSNLATYLQFNTFPNGSGAGAAEISQRWDGIKDIEQQEKVRSRLQASLVDPLVLLEGKLVTELLTNLPVSRNLLEGLPNLSPENSQEVMVMALRPAAQFQQFLQTSGDPMSLLAFTTWILADLFHRGRQAQGDQQLLSQAFQLYMQAEDQAGMALCQMTLGDWMSAPYSHPVVWNFAIQSSPSEGSQLSWTVEMMEISQAGLDPGSALAAYDQAEQLFRAAGAPRGLAAIALRRAYLAMLSGAYQTAVGHARQAQDGFQACGDILGYRSSQVHRILSRVGAGEFPEERGTAAEIGAWGASQGSFSYTLGLGLLLGRAGHHWLIRRGDYERSLACYRLAEALYAELGAGINRAQSLVDQGNVYQAVGDRTAALILYEQALDAHAADIAARPAIAPEVRDQALSLSVTVYNLYLQYMQADGMERSARRMQSILEQYPGGKEDITGIAELFGGGVQELFSTGLDQATVVDKSTTAIKSWALTNLVRSTLDQARVLVPLYRALQVRDQGDEAAAQQSFSQAREAALQAGALDRYLMESTVLAHQKEYSSAVAAFKQYLAEQAENTGFTGNLVKWMAAIAGERGQEESRRQVENTLELAFTFLTRCKAYEEAHHYLEALVQSAGQDWWQRDSRPWLSLSDCGELYEGLAQLEKALDFYDQAIRELEKRRNQLSRDELKTALAADKGTQFLYFQAARSANKIVQQARQEGDEDRRMAFAARLFDYAERSKARALLDLMAGSAVLTGSALIEQGTLNASMRSWRQINAQLTLRRGLLAQERNRQGDGSEVNRIDQLSQQIEADEAELHRVESELAGTNPEFYRAINPQASVMTLEQVSTAIPPQTALLQYYFLGEELLSWAITSLGIAEIHQMPLDTKSLERQIRAFHRACEEQKPLDNLGKELAETFLIPLTETINACEHLLIVPYGAAHVLPFHVLPWSGQPLSTTRDIRYLPSASTLQFLVNRPTNGLDSILAIGNPADMHLQAPDGSFEPAPSLSWAETEAIYVTSLFRQGEALVREKATEESFRQQLQGKSILHLATHGYLSVDSPLASSILFAEGHELTVYELMGLQLDGQLVVLSACQTAQGEITGGDDVLGFTRGLLGAGVRAVVVSLWPVDDLSTSLFMGEFYRQLLAEKVPAIALQGAQNYLRSLDAGSIQSETAKLHAALKTAHPGSTAVSQVENQVSRRQLRPPGMAPAEDDYSHPFYWAPFILVG